MYDEDGYEYPIDDEHQIYVPLKLEKIVAETKNVANIKETEN